MPSAPATPRGSASGKPASRMGGHRKTGYARLNRRGRWGSDANPIHNRGYRNKYKPRPPIRHCSLRWRPRLPRKRNRPALLRRYACGKRACSDLLLHRTGGAQGYSRGARDRRGRLDARQSIYRQAHEGIPRFAPSDEGCLAARVMRGGGARGKTQIKEGANGERRTETMSVLRRRCRTRRRPVR